DCDVSEAIRTMAVSACAHYVARHGAIRDLLVTRQRDIGRTLGSFVSEGRDQGSVVFPNADAKFVLDASLEKRAERRFREMVAEGEEVEIAAVMENLTSRDMADAKQWAPLLRPGQAIVIDTTDLTIGQVVDRMVAVISTLKSREKGVSP
ncbi:unnamed protein product, partial [marine sediment metagenome]